MIARGTGWVLAVVGLLLAAGVLARVWPLAGERGAGAMPHQAYVWQRLWSAPVRDAVGERAGALDALVVLAAEVRFSRGTMQVTRVEVPWESLRGRRIGIALRIGPFAGPFGADDAVAQRLCDEARAALEEATAAGVEVTELQIDFDAAASRLDGYRVWLGALRRCHPPRLTITALPAWLDARGFGALVRQTDGFVLQVHSFSRPRTIQDNFPLCDPDAAWRATERAARFDVPFRVALPTYGYDAVFDARGRFVRALAETARPPGAPWRTRRIEADAPALAALVRQWMTDRPALMRGVIWYRLPTAQDRLNWSWITLERVMGGVRPQSHLEAVALGAQDGRLFEIVLRNTGTNAAPLAGMRVRVTCDTGKLVAGDAYWDFAFADREAAGIMLVGRREALPLAPGDQRPLGWVRFASDTEVHAHVITDDLAAGAAGRTSGAAADPGLYLYQPQ